MDSQELRRMSTPPTEADTRPDASAQTLQPTDGGIAAWRLLFAAFVFETLLWGFPLSFGVFQEYYSRLPQFENNPYIGVVGTVASGMSYIAAPIVIPIIGRYAQYRRRMIWIGWPICLLSLVAGSFAKTLEGLIITQGVMYGSGFIVFYYPILSMVNEYWIARRGMAYGILCSASGLSGAVMPFITQALLQSYGYPTTLRVMAIALLVLTAPLIPLLKGRGHETAIGSSRIDWTFLRTASFWVYNLSNVAMGIGYFYPALYLPSYAVSNGFSPLQGAMLLAIMSVSQVLGQLSFGYLSDRSVSIVTLTTTSPLVAAVAVYTCWGFADSLTPMVIFALVYGFFASGYTATWARIGSSISSEPSAAFAAFGLLNLGKGLGNILTGPVGGFLLGNDTKTGTYGALRYERIVLFTGSCLLLSGVTILLHRSKELVTSWM